MKFKNQSEQAICEEQAKSDGVELNEWVKRRYRLLGKLTIHRPDFRRKQSASRSWKLNRARYQKGIDRWHASTSGKRFHRQLGRFLALRAPLYKEGLTNEGLSQLGYSERIEDLVALHSLKTHLVIEKLYVVPDVSEHDMMQEFLDLSLVHVGEAISAVEAGSPLDDDTMEFIGGLINKSEQSSEESA